MVSEEDIATDEVATDEVATDEVATDDAVADESSEAVAEPVEPATTSEPVATDTSSGTSISISQPQPVVVPSGGTLYAPIITGGSTSQPAQTTNTVIVKDYDNDIEDLEDDVDDLDDRVDDLEDDVEEIDQDQDENEQAIEDLQDQYEEDQDELDDQLADLQRQLDEVQQTSYTYNEYHVYNEPSPAVYPIDAQGYVEPSRFDYDYGHGNSNTECNMNSE